MKKYKVVLAILIGVLLLFFIGLTIDHMLSDNYKYRNDYVRVIYNNNVDVMTVSGEGNLMIYDNGYIDDLDIFLFKDIRKELFVYVEGKGYIKTNSIARIYAGNFNLYIKVKDLNYPLENYENIEFKEGGN
jgi:hypothetical protein